MITPRRALHGLAAVFTGIGLWGFHQAERIQAVETKKKKKKKKKKRGDSEMPNSRNVATIPNFSVANGSYIVPNSDLVTTNFVLQGDTSGAGAWSTIPVTEYELFPKTGVIAQRVQDYASGAFVDWSGYQAYRLSAYTKNVSGTRTSYTNQTVTFAESNEGYSPIGQVGELNGEAIKNAIVNLLVAAGAAVVIDDDGITFTAGTGSKNKIKWNDSGSTYTTIHSIGGAATSLNLTADPGNLATEASINIQANTSGGSGLGGINLASGSLTWAKKGAVGAGTSVKLGGLLSANTSTVTVANTASETTLSTGGTLVANTLTVGDTVRLKASGIFSTNATPTLRFRVFLGATPVSSTGTQTAPNTVTNRGWALETVMTVRSIGATGTAFSQGHTIVALTGTTAESWDMEATNTDTLDFTGNLAPTLQVTWGTAGAANTISMTNCTWELLNAN